MCCGVVQNAYHTLDSMRFVLPDGLVVDTAESDADERLAREAPELVEGLVELRRRILGNPVLHERIRTKYRMKNTNGYSLNAFLDFERPVDILAHLMIGSEGTLGFIAEAVLDTVPDYPLKYTGLLHFADVPSACSAIAALRDSGARALELMDRASLRSIADQPGVPGEIRRLPSNAAALLVEYQCETEDELDERRRACRDVLPSLPLLHPPDFTTDADRQAALWKVRKGLIPSVGAMRRRGTSFILEDVVFPIPHLAEGVSDLQELFERFGYDDAIVFGHAKDGNLHFVLIQAFDDPGDVERYDRFMHALAEVVVGRYDGALKAEHGTGRNMAPFVGSEWGPEAYALMQELKRLVDPDGLLNPGVILNDDPRAHVRHLKDLPTVEDEVDQCIECGFCERMCPSRELTLTPRQRIVVCGGKWRGFARPARRSGPSRSSRPTSPTKGSTPVQLTAFARLPARSASIRANWSSVCVSNHTRRRPRSWLRWLPRGFRGSSPWRVSACGSDVWCGGTCLHRPAPPGLGCLASEPVRFTFRAVSRGLSAPMAERARPSRSPRP